MICKNCGAEIKEGSNFCEACGTEVKKEKPKTIIEEKVVKTKVRKENSDRRGGSFGLGIFFILAGLGGLGSDFPFASITILCGMLCLPPVRDLVHFKHKNAIFNITIILLFFITSLGL